jgi:tetratricopeptide (TPR) repeat protein
MNIAIHTLVGPRKKITVDDQFLASFGRSPEADMVIDDQHVSKFHGEFYVAEGQLMVRDLGSTHGIKVNGELTVEKVLAPGDVISLGQIKVFMLVSTDTPQAHESRSLTPPSPLKTQTPTTDLSVLDHEPEVFALTAHSPGSMQKKKASEPVEQPTKVIKPWMLAVGGVVLVLVVLAILKPSETTPKPLQELSPSGFSQMVDQGVELFRQKKYGEAISKCKSTLDRFHQNHVAHMVIELCELWIHKGDRYEQFNWKKAQELSEELLNGYPNTPGSQQLAKDLLKWITVEEKNMAKMQQVLGLSQQKKWDQALAESKTIAPESKFLELYAEELKNIWTESNLGHERQMNLAINNQDWPKAIQQIDILQKNGSERDDLPSLRERYQRFIRDKSTFEAAEKAYEAKNYLEVNQQVLTIQKDSPYFDRAQQLLTHAVESDHQAQRAELFRKGDGAAAIEYSQQNFPDDKAFVEKVNSVMELSKKAQQKLTTTHPEDVVPVCQELFSLVNDPQNSYQQQARSWYKRWSDPTFMADTYLGRAKTAMIEDRTEDAVELFLKAQALDASKGVEELKGLEKKGWDYYNQAMGFSYSEDIANVRLYLKKATQCVPKNSKLYDRIEAYARKYLSN